MGFFDVCKSVMNYLSEKSQEMQAEYERHYNRYKDESDARLIELCKHSTGTKKAALVSLLRERGYDSSDVND